MGGLPKKCRRGTTAARRRCSTAGRRTDGPRREAPRSSDQDSMATASVAAPQPTTRRLEPAEPVPPATLAPDTAASPSPEPLPPQPPEAVARQAPPVRRALTLAVPRHESGRGSRGSMAAGTLRQGEHLSVGA